MFFKTMKKDSLKSPWLKRGRNASKLVGTRHQLHLTSHERLLLMRMASRRNLRVDAFALQVAQDEHNKIGNEQPKPWEDPTVIRLGPEDYAFFLDLLENPPPPSEKLKEAYRDYLASVRSSDDK